MNAQDRLRYIRQIIYPPIGTAGQDRLLEARVLLVGCGATGSAIANTLVRAGVGRLTLVDRDFIELNNLQRQILYDEADVAAGLPKAVAAAKKLAGINSAVTLEPVVADVNADNIEDLVEPADLVMDGTDNLETRFLVNDACVKLGKPWIYSGAVAATGMSMTILPGETACYRCVFHNPASPGMVPTCDTAGIIGPIVSTVAALACSEAIKYLTGNREHLNRGLTSVDLWENSFDTFQVVRRPDCPACGQHRFDFLSGAHAGISTALLCGKNSVQVRPGQRRELDLARLAAQLAAVGRVSQNDYLLKFITEPFELTIFPDARAIIQGTDDENVAKSVYARYVGN